jgi:hypothetical protein
LDSVCASFLGLCAHRLHLTIWRDLLGVNFRTCVTAAYFTHTLRAKTKAAAPLFTLQVQIKVAFSCRRQAEMKIFKLKGSIKDLKISKSLSSL